MVGGPPPEHYGASTLQTMGERGGRLGGNGGKESRDAVGWGAVLAASM